MRTNFFDQTQRKVAVMQAYLEGKTIQMRARAIGPWEDWTVATSGEPQWNWVHVDWRIKPREPQVVYCIIRDADQTPCTVYSEWADANRVNSYSAGKNTVRKFIEVMEEESQ